MEMQGLSGKEPEIQQTKPPDTPFYQKIWFAAVIASPPFIIFALFVLFNGGVREWLVELIAGILRSLS